MAKLYARSSQEISEREIRNMERSRRIAGQGMVLLKNDGVLPLKGEVKKIALFGNGARRTVKGGTGSGDVNSRFVINIEQGLEEGGYQITTKQWMNRYDQIIEEAREQYFQGIRDSMKVNGQAAIMELFTDPFREPSVIPVSDADVETTKADVAIYVISRNSGEGKDRKPVPGDYELYPEEEASLYQLTEHYQDVIVVLNVGGVIDTKVIRGMKNIGAILLMSQAGNIGGNALCDVLKGKTDPCGHLTATWAENYEDYPSAATFSHMNGDTDDEYYEEGIFVGYRYFDSFGIAPAYPFGYGSSYADFQWKVTNTELDHLQIKVSVEVRNISTRYAGKEVIQIYYSAPQGELEKPYQELAAFQKTKMLNPGETQQFTVQFPVTQMSSYSEREAAYVLEPGKYYIRVGVHSRKTVIAAAVEVFEKVRTKKLENRLPLDCELTEISVKNAKSYTYPGEQKEKESAEVLQVQTGEIVTETVTYQKETERYEKTVWDHTITMDEVREGTYTLEEMVGQLTVEEMAALCVGTSGGQPGSQSVIGSASVLCPGAAGDTTSLMLEDRDIRNIVLADGPAGLRLSSVFMTDSENHQIPGIGGPAIPGMDELFKDQPKPEIPQDAKTYYQYCTAIPIATLLAQTWDPERIMEAGDIVGEEMKEFGVTIWLAPGMNIHRNPLCGRNFEYYSEDPLLSGICAAADTLGVQKHSGVGTCIKHFALNNQEDNRMHVSAHVSERAAREIYLKGFEIAVKTAQPMSIMTSYNLINGIHSANNEDLLNGLARNEWGFEGIVMTDWGTTGGMEMEPGRAFKYGCSSAAGCIKAGNDLIMPGSQKDVDEIIRAVGAEEGEAEETLSLGELQACARRILQIIGSSHVYE